MTDKTLDENRKAIAFQELESVAREVFITLIACPSTGFATRQEFAEAAFDFAETFLRERDNSKATLLSPRHGGAC